MFLDLGTIDIGGQIILAGGRGCPGNCTTFSSGLDLYSPDVSSTAPNAPSMTVAVSLDVARCPWEGKMAPS